MSPSRLHSTVVRNLILIFSKLCYDTFPNLTVTVDENRAVDVDLAVDRSGYSCNANDISTKVSPVPELCIEVLSPQQAISDLIEKAQWLMENDAMQYWLINPFQNAITVFFREENGTLSRKDYTGDSEIPDPFGGEREIALSEIFR